MLIHKQLPTFDAVQAGRKAVCTIEQGIRLAAIHLELGNAAVAANGISDVVGDITLKLFGKPQRVFTGAQLDGLNTLNGADYASKNTGTAGQADYVNYLSIFLWNPWRLDSADRIAPAWSLISGSGRDASVQVEVNLLAGLAAPFVRGTFEYDSIPEGVKDIGIIQKVLRNDISAVGTSRDVLTLDKLDLYESIHLFPTVGGTSRYVTQAKFVRNGQDVMENITHLQNRVNLQRASMNPETGATPRYDIVFDRSDRVRDGLIAAGTRDMKLSVTWDGAANGVMPVLVQRTGSPE